MNASKLTLVLPILLTTAVCGLVLASYAEYKQRGKLAHSANYRVETSSGAQWRWQNPLPQGNNLRGVSLVDANTGTLVGDYGTIVRTTDGGAHWTLQTSNTTDWLYTVHFTDENNGTVVGFLNGTILRTINGGQTWVPQSSTATGLLGVYFTDANHARSLVTTASF